MRFIGALVVTIILVALPYWLWGESLKSADFWREYGTNLPVEMLLYAVGAIAMFAVNNVVRLFSRIGRRKPAPEASPEESEDTNIFEAMANVRDAILAADIGHLKSEFGGIVVNINSKIDASDYTAAFAALSELEGELWAHEAVSRKYKLFEALHGLRGALYDELQELEEEKSAEHAKEKEKAERAHVAEEERRREDAEAPTPLQKALKAHRIFVHNLNEAVLYAEVNENDSYDDFREIVEEHLPLLERYVANGNIPAALEELATLESKALWWHEACNELDIVESAFELRAALATLLPVKTPEEAADAHALALENA